MTNALSPRLSAVVEALPLRPGMRVLEIGCGPGAAARAALRRMGQGHLLAIDRSAKAITQAVAASRVERASGMLTFRCVAVEDLVLAPGNCRMTWHSRYGLAPWMAAILQRDAQRLSG